MTTKTDGRTVRGAVRRMAWGIFAAAAESSDGARMYEDDRLEALYQTTRREVLRWMKARSRGVMGPPPGGVGTKK